MKSQLWVSRSARLSYTVITDPFRPFRVAFLAYDHLLTLPGEIELVWKRKFTGATALFILLRYFTLISKISLLVATFPWPNQTDQVCS